MEEPLPFFGGQGTADRVLTFREIVDVVCQSSPPSARLEDARQHTDVHVDGPVPDLERIAPEAFIAAAEIFLKRPLTMAELAELNARFTSSGYDFAAWVQDHLGVPLKQRDGHLAEPFAALLARVFPERRDAQKWNAVWDVCDRVLQLAKRPRPLPQMAIGLAGRGRKA